MYTSVADKQTQVFEYREASHLETIGSKMAFELEKAQAYGQGYEKSLNLPRESYGDSYEIRAVDSFIIINSGSTELTSPARYSDRELTVKSEEGPFEVINNGSVYVVPQ